jgi:hypothetical protein
MHDGSVSDVVPGEIQWKQATWYDWGTSVRIGNTCGKREPRKTMKKNASVHVGWFLTTWLRKPWEVWDRLVEVPGCFAGRSEHCLLLEVDLICCHEYLVG